jgi:excisionase family DNA binding protein
LQINDLRNGKKLAVGRIRQVGLAWSMNDPQIMATFNQEKILSATGKPYTSSMIKWIRLRHAIPAPSPKLPGELTVGEAAKYVKVSHGVVYYWIERNHLSARKTGPGLPLCIKLSPETETQLQCWVANSNRIKQSQPPNPAAPCAI